ncbi:MAG: cyanophycinase [Planctomycetia bacterium]|nr:cyanophycinase [Planctomycetia bacterium]
MLGTCLICIATAVRGDETRGTLVIIGGGLAPRSNESEIWDEIVELAGGDEAKIAVFPTASGTPVESARRAMAALDKAGADPFMVPLALLNFDRDFRQVVVDQETIDKVRSSGGIFFTGGDQKRIIKALKTPDGENTPLLDAVWDVYRKGGVIAGTSAGAAVLSRVMFSDPGTVLTTLQEGVKLGKEIDEGLGFLDHSWFIEQHCLTRGRFARALVAMHAQDLKFCIGVDENTAAVVRNDCEVKVVGDRGAVVIDLSTASHDPAVRGFNLKNVRLTYLGHGDTFDLRNMTVTPANDKQNGSIPLPKGSELDSEPARMIVNYDILGNTTMKNVLQGLLSRRKVEAIGLAFDGAAARSGPTPGFEFRFYPAADTAGWYGEEGFTAHNIHLDVRPIRFSGAMYTALDVEDSDEVQAPVAGQ